mmetsp:Transcript_81736/g.100243  ORF Transcript_81736/g.100243 Transcript_81736/m.100243 type:complete len:210 (-) Transcript_81736:234-863(-)
MLSDRILFVSLLGFSNCWKDLTNIQLQYCVLMISIKKEWLFKKIKCDDNILYTYNMYSNKDLMMILKYKYSQGLIIFMSDNNNQVPSTPVFIVNKSWENISNKIESLYDIKTNKKYNSLALSQNDWFNDISVLNELKHANGNYKCIKKIISKTNPSFHIIALRNDFENYGSTSNEYLPSNTDTNNDDGLTFISSDYLNAINDTEFDELQ